MLADHYRSELDDALFRDGEINGRVTTSMSILTDSLLMLNALELYYQKPASKAIAPSEIAELRRNIDAVKDLLREILTSRAEPDRGALS